MKNIIITIINSFRAAAGKKSAAAEDVKEKMIRAAVEYAGLEVGKVIVDEAGSRGDNGEWYRVVFHDADKNYCRCGMSWECWMDSSTGEVTGFMGQAQESRLDYPARERGRAEDEKLPEACAA